MRLIFFKSPSFKSSAPWDFVRLPDAICPWTSLGRSRSLTCFDMLALEPYPLFPGPVRVSEFVLHLFNVLSDLNLVQLIPFRIQDIGFMGGIGIRQVFMNKARDLLHAHGLFSLDSSPAVNDMVFVFCHLNHRDGGQKAVMPQAFN